MNYKKKVMIPWNKGKKLKPLSDEHKKKLSLALKGRKRSQEVIDKLKGIKKPKSFIEYRRKLWMGNQIWKGKHHTEETKQKIRCNKNSSGWKPTIQQRLRWGHKKENHWNWKGGITPINQGIRKAIEYKLWREAVFERDNYTCVWCGSKSCKGNAVILEADHIKSFSRYPELRLAIDNGRTLCINCHKKTDTYKGKSNRKQNDFSQHTKDSSSGQS